MEIQHFIHEHPLSFIKEGNKMKRCKVCWTYLSGPTYGCEPCKYFLHKSCLDEFKEEVQSSFHLCPLRIAHYFKYSFHARSGDCFLCYETITSNFSYICKLSCTFQTHVECAVTPIVEYSDEEYTIRHFTHHHPLKLVDSNQKDEVICSFCEELCSSSSSSTYGCMRCEFFLHKSCMKSIPRQMINHRIHPCALIFISSDRYSDTKCDCCGEHIVPGMQFSCGACAFNLHIKCALFPIIDSEDAKEIQHFSHPHTLALVQNDEEYSSEARCVACAQICLAPPAPTFRCSRSCNHFFLHKSCYVKLPYKSYKIKHPSHPDHPLTIKSLPYNDHIHTCDACCRGIDSTLLAYSCREYECKFNLHLDCYKVLASIKFSGHKHLLTLFEKTADVTCHLCGGNCCNFVLRCVPCDINIHLQCFPSAPKTIKHKCHLHPLILTKSHFEYELNSDEEEDEFYCDVCEQKRNRKELVYYCVECKFIAEVKCVVDEVLPLIYENHSFDKEILVGGMSQKVEFYPEIQKWHVENLLLRCIKLEVKMKQLQEEMDGVRNEIKKTSGILSNLVGGSSGLLNELVENNSQLRDLCLDAKYQGLRIEVDW